MPPLAPTVDDLSGCSRHIVLAARERLRKAAYIHVRTVSCEFDEGLLTLHGQVTSYYEKQLAQEAVARIDGVTQVLNAVEVV